MLCYYDLSPGRMLEVNKLAAKLNVPRSEVLEAMRLRNNLPAMAEEYLRNKNLVLPEGEKFPLWAQYLGMVSDAKDY